MSESEQHQPRQKLYEDLDARIELEQSPGWTYFTVTVRAVSPRDVGEQQEPANRWAPTLEWEETLDPEGLWEFAQLVAVVRHALDEDLARYKRALDELPALRQQWKDKDPRYPSPPLDEGPGLGSGQQQPDEPGDEAR